MRVVRVQKKRLNPWGPQTCEVSRSIRRRRQTDSRYSQEWNEVRVSQEQLLVDTDCVCISKSHANAASSVDIWQNKHTHTQPTYSETQRSKATKYSGLGLRPVLRKLAVHRLISVSMWSCVKANSEPPSSCRQQHSQIMAQPDPGGMRYVPARTQRSLWVQAISSVSTRTQAGRR